MNLWKSITLLSAISICSLLVSIGISIFLILELNNFSEDFFPSTEFLNTLIFRHICIVIVNFTSIIISLALTVFTIKKYHISDI